jgi:hypothetical protein
MNLMPVEPCDTGRNFSGESGVYAMGGENRRLGAVLSIREGREPAQAVQHAGCTGVSKTGGARKPMVSLPMIRRFMVMIAIAVALFPMCGDGNDV